VGAERSVRDDGPRGADADQGGSRVVRAAGGMRWRATVVARLVTDELGTGREHTRLVLQLDCLSARRRPLRTAVAGVSSLDAMADEAVRALIQPRSRSGRGARAPKPGGRVKRSGR
jgi:hypothetical protein